MAKIDRLNEDNGGCSGIGSGVGGQGEDSDGWFGGKGSREGKGRVDLFDLGFGFSKLGGLWAVMVFWAKAGLGLL